MNGGDSGTFLKLNGTFSLPCAHNISIWSRASTQAQMREFGRAAGINDPGGVVRLKAKVGTKGTVLLLRQDTAWRCIDVFTSRGGVIPPPPPPKKKKKKKKEDQSCRREMRLRSFQSNCQDKSLGWIFGGLGALFTASADTGRELLLWPLDSKTKIPLSGFPQRVTSTPLFHFYCPSSV